MSSSESSQTSPHQPKSNHLHALPPTSSEQTEPEISEQAELEPSHINCLAILPLRSDGEFDFYSEILAPALCKTLENAPCYWEVITFASIEHFRISDEQKKQKKQKNIKVYIVDVSDKNIDMILELGTIRELGREKNAPIFVLCHKEESSGQAHKGNRPKRKKEWVREWANKRNFYVIQYFDIHKIHLLDNQRDIANEIEAAIAVLVKSLKQDFLMIDAVKELNRDTSRQHYLAPSELSELSGIKIELAEALADICGSKEVFVGKNANIIHTELKNTYPEEIATEQIVACQEIIKKKFLINNVFVQ